MTEAHYTDDAVTLHHGDCLDVLRGMPDSSVDAIVTDPPAGISFMSKSWDHDLGGRTEWVAWMTEVMTEALRVIRPGGHALVWALPRTSHWTSWAIESAGFDVRDCIVHIFGTGFPKSLDVGKAIAKAAGVERKVIGPDPQAARRSINRFVGTMNGGRVSEDNRAEVPLTAPATDDAARWAGFGTALKPASEHWWLARKPLGAGTVAGNVLRYGTGALNIDACRVETSDDLNGGAYSGDLRQRAERTATDTESGAVAMSRLNRGAGDYIAPNGRWPANVVLSHTEWCVEVGTRQARTGTAVNRNRTPDNDRATYAAYSMGNKKSGGDVSYGTDGTETVAAWDCPEGCPVRELDAQSGVTSSPTSTGRGAGGQHGITSPRGAQGQVWAPGDTGGASRFFPTFRYQAKAPSSERPGYVDDDGVSQAHSTVKPLDLMRWLVRLVTPPGGTVLDPFAGSGTTGEACSLEGFECVLIEREARYLALIGVRLGWCS